MSENEENEMGLVAGIVSDETKVYQLRCLNNCREEVEFWITPPQTQEAKDLIQVKRGKEKNQVYKVKYGKVAEFDEFGLARSSFSPDDRGQFVQPANLYETEVCTEELPALMQSLLNGSIATNKSNQ